MPLYADEHGQLAFHDVKPDGEHWTLVKPDMTIYCGVDARTYTGWIRGAGKIVARVSGTVYGIPFGDLKHWRVNVNVNVLQLVVDEFGRIQRCEHHPENTPGVIRILRDKTNLIINVETFEVLNLDACHSANVVRVGNYNYDLRPNEWVWIGDPGTGVSCLGMVDGKLVPYKTKNPPSAWLIWWDKGDRFARLETSDIYWINDKPHVKYTTRGGGVVTMDLAQFAEKFQSLPITSEQLRVTDTGHLFWTYLNKPVTTDHRVLHAMDTVMYDGAAYRYVGMDKWGWFNFKGKEETQVRLHRDQLGRVAVMPVGPQSPEGHPGLRGPTGPDDPMFKDLVKASKGLSDVAEPIQATKGDEEMRTKDQMKAVKPGDSVYVREVHAPLQVVQIDHDNQVVIGETERGSVFIKPFADIVGEPIPYTPPAPSKVKGYAVSLAKATGWAGVVYAIAHPEHVKQLLSLFS